MSKSENIPYWESNKGYATGEIVYFHNFWGLGKYQCMTNNISNENNKPSLFKTSENYPEYWEWKQELVKKAIRDNSFPPPYTLYWVLLNQDEIMKQFWLNVFYYIIVWVGVLLTTGIASIALKKFIKFNYLYYIIASILYFAIALVFNNDLLSKKSENASQALNVILFSIIMTIIIVLAVLYRTVYFRTTPKRSNTQIAMQNITRTP